MDLKDADPLEDQVQNHPVMKCSAYTLSQLARCISQAERLEKTQFTSTHHQFVKEVVLTRIRTYIDRLFNGEELDAPSRTELSYIEEAVSDLVDR